MVKIGKYIIMVIKPFYMALNNLKYTNFIYLNDFFLS